MAATTTFKYEIMGADGKKKKGSIEASSREAALSELRMGGNLVLSLNAGSVLDKEINISIGKAVKPRELSIFCRQFQSVLAAGVTVVECLGMLGEQTENKVFQKAILEVRDSVQKGETLSNAMAQHPKVFPDIMIQMVTAGEISGSLEVAFDRLGKQFEKEAHLSGMIMKSMIYPVILIIVIVVVVIIMMTVIVPTFTDTFADLGAELPGITKAVMAVSDFLVNNWYYLLGGIVAIAIFLRAIKKTESGALLFGKISLKLPLFGTLAIKSASASLTRTLSTLMAAGITLVEAIKIIQKIVKNAVVQKALERAERDVTEGRPLSVSIEESEVFPPMVYHMIRIGEETGNMESMLDKISDYYDEEVEMATQSLLAAMEPMIIIAMAAVVVPIILAIMLPMLSINNAIGA